MQQSREGVSGPSPAQSLGRLADTVGLEALGWDTREGAGGLFRGPLCLR